MEKEGKRSLEVEIGALGAPEIGDALGAIARGMRDNPIHVAVFGEDPERREERLRRLFGGVFEAPGWHKNMLVARDESGAIVGVMGMRCPGDCQTTSDQILGSYVVSNDPEVAGRIGAWPGAWAARDPEERHVHLGPLSVDAHLQGRGVGSKLIRVFAARMGAAGEDAYLETDRAINVKLYERFGFEAVGTEEILGTTNWFMIRPAKKRN